MKRTKLLPLAALFLGASLMVLLLWGSRTDRTPPDAEKTSEVSTTRLAASREVHRSDAAQAVLNSWRTNAVLERLSTNNAAFQAWGKQFMLRVANDHLSKVPLFGLKV